MRFRLIFVSIATVCLAGCSAIAAEMSRDMAPQISTDVMVQLGTEMTPQVSTEVAVQLATALADVSATPITPSKLPTEAADAEYDCQPKTCGNMASCEEAVYKLYVCEHSQRDADNNGVPCESLCRGTDVPAIAASFAGVMLTSPPGAEEVGPVTRIVDGDTIDVLLDGKNTRIRYLQMNTPERDEPCYSQANEANRKLVEGKTVRLVADKELVDIYDRLLRFIYVDDVLVNRVLVEQGFAEVVLYPPNDAHYDEFVQLEAEATADGLGCHPTGVFDDGSTTR